MNEDYTREEWIEKYLDNALDEKRRAEFEQKLHEDPQLAQALQFEKNFRLLEKQEDEMIFREKLNETINTYRYQETGTKTSEPDLSNKENKKTLRFFQNYFRVAATFLALVSLALLLFFLLRSTKTQEDKLFGQYFEPYATDFISRSGDDTLVFPVKALFAYSEGDYPSAINLLEEKRLEFPDNEMILFYLGISCLADDQFSKAESCFSLLRENPSGSFYEQAKWYYALTLLKTGKDRQFLIILFRQIEREGKFKAKESAEIARRL